MRPLSRPLAPSLCLVVLLAGCAAPGPYPSLAPRPIERALAEADLPRPAPPPAPDAPEVAQGVSALIAAARSGGALAAAGRGDTTVAPAFL